MITRNFKNILSGMLQSLSSAYGSVPIYNTAGTKYYFSPQFGKFPNSRTQTYTLSANDAGVSFGKGARAASEDDYNLQTPITSGITVTLTSVVPGCNSPANPYIEYTFTITNTSGSPLTITEVGYKQVVNASNTPGRNASSEITVLLDRTVLDTALTIEAGDAGILKYRLETIPEPTQQTHGIDIVSFEWGSDEQIAAIIDAAQAGTIDLQNDIGWKVGDMRKITISAFTGGNNVSHAQQNIDIVITSFDDYNSCGCVLQFDFKECLASGQRMNSTNTTTGGYGATEMYTTTLPALANALPSWLASRLKTFSVLARVGGSSTSVETVTGNKLALRSVQELFGTNTGEGTHLDYYNSDGRRVKTWGYSGSATSWWERSAYSGSYFYLVSNTGASFSNDASNVRGVAPFGCI